MRSLYFLCEIGNIGYFIIHSILSDYIVACKHNHTIRTQSVFDDNALCQRTTEPSTCVKNQTENDDYGIIALSDLILSLFFRSYLL
jgi:hypothetical protein